MQHGGSSHTYQMEVAPRMADTELSARIAARGYCTLPVMDSAEAVALGHQILASLPEDLHESQPGSHWHHGLMGENREQNFAIARLMADFVIPRLSQHLIDARCSVAASAVKPAKSPGTPLHQHYPTSADPFACRISVWLALSAGPDVARTFRLVPFSQRMTRFLRTRETGDYFDGYCAQIEASHLKDIVLDPGEAVFFEDSILHSTGTNPANSPRVNTIATFLGSTMPSAHYSWQQGSEFTRRVRSDTRDFASRVRYPDSGSSKETKEPYIHTNQKLSLAEFQAKLMNRRELAEI